MNRKRIHYESGNEELEEPMNTCVKCKHHYVKVNDRETIHCACRKGCRFEPLDKEVKDERN